MASRKASAGVLSLVLFSTLAQPSFAGGLERGGYNIDLLFDQSRFSAQSALIYVMPQRKLKNVQDVDPTNGVPSGPNSADDTENYVVPYAGFKGGMGDVDCLVDYSEPFGAHTNPGQNWAGANSNVETKISSHNYAATCSYKFDAGQGQMRLIGGAFYQEIEGFQEKLLAPIPNGTGRLDMSDRSWGWRVGVAYEIPEYALRASLVYNSKVKYDNLTGTVNLTNVGGPIIPVTGSAEAPDSLELKLQSGIAPDWLAFGSVKWTNWSVLQSVPFSNASGIEITSLDLAYRDGWTVTGGIGHKFNDQWTGAVSLTWDRGTSDGYGTQTDTWTLGVGAAYNPTENVEWRLAGAIGVLTSGESGTFTRDGVTYGEDATYTFGNDLVAALSTSIKVKF
ncbi:OmpP1/FadL family transporter [Rhizobium sp. S152]|uniref:OmpP1/FadL family transporter n=1 Tax=Rhizobium sp. S152 TaxID=3055038 RepID=UPI0025AA067F|nr:OmpP1/FadL family transporter [Rhizobium sp. S152]MDM9629564.1 OmpP1/FadL family transporter [Rhizobium sp. S152]